VSGSIMITKIKIKYRKVTDIEAKEIAEAPGVTIGWVYDEKEKEKDEIRPGRESACGK